MAPRMMNYLFLRLTKHMSDKAYYWLLERLRMIPKGWRPIWMRYPEHFPERHARHN